MQVKWMFCALVGLICIISYLMLYVDVYMSNVYLNVKRVLEMNYILPSYFIILANMISYVLYKK